VAIVTAIIVGVVTFALELITINQIERSLSHLQLQFRALANGDFNPPIHLEKLVMSKELREVDVNFDRLKLALSTTFSEAQRKIEEQERIQEKLQAELTRLQHTIEEQKIGKENLQSQVARLEIVLEKALEENQTLAGKITQDNEGFDEPEGEMVDFISHMQGEFQEPPKSAASLTSSSLEEIRQYKDELQYRIAWLRTLLEDAEKELKLICITCEL
jgi:chromosome segregation ATPase